MTKEEKNRKIAEWLGFTQEVSHFQPPPLYLDRTEIVWRHPTEDITTGLPDFYRDEAANAMVRETMPFGVSIIRTDRGWNIRHYNNWRVFDTDYKAAICEAALQLIERQERTA